MLQGLLQAKLAEEQRPVNVEDVEDVEVVVLQAAMGVRVALHMRLPSFDSCNGCDFTSDGPALKRLAAFRDRDAGSTNNRAKPTDDNVRSDRHAAGHNQRETESRGHGARRRGGDRHTRGLPKYTIIPITKFSNLTWP